MAVTKATQHSQKPHETSSYACHICGLNGHKMIDYLKFIKMSKMVHGKYVTVVEIQPIVETQTIITNVNVVDVNVITTEE